MIYPDENGQAAATLYEGDGVSPGYKQGVFRRTRVSVSRSGNGFQIEVSAPDGAYNPGPHSMVFVVKSPSAARQVLVDGKPLATSRANETRSGWYKFDDGVAVRIADDGKTHRIQIR